MTLVREHIEPLSPSMIGGLQCDSDHDSVGNDLTASNDDCSYKAQGSGGRRG
ncbi:hypothetical protein DICSQDRAFT_134807 [Dichomitus squalens LYAD-421 SS1]|uniref:uncharacterized protein n=1 Tax=Dichomitus squalens (strain LYAD-421) TaxID=732165 RepID=UPI0004415EE9|nr:uncharacterized protein DICSQDRAFT_134807 [Dichomitus squalens LYAD-421 SS1]EJF63364.1 hypothetical protein DICSQDRAFT_134807 [Dichomitus squalens LYAD-421 SS1]